MRALEGGRFDIVCACLPRAQGKSSLAAELCRRFLTPGDVLHRPGTEALLVASTISAARKTVFKLLRRAIEARPDADQWRISESANACHVRHVESNTRVSVVAATAKAVLGLVGCPLVVVDEPGAYDLTGGEAVWDALSTATGKPDSPLRVFIIGHLAPKATGPGHWYYDLVHGGTTGRTFVYAIQGKLDRWDQPAEIRRCSPLSWSFPESRAKLLEERDKARHDPRAKGSFLSYRLNFPAGDESKVLLTVPDWKRVEGRPVGDRDGRPVVGLDLGAGRSWSAAVAIWPSGRCEALAVAPGTPGVEEQERRDGVKPGTYRRLFEAGIVTTDGELRVPRVGVVVDRIRQWRPDVIVCDRFRLSELLDAKPPCAVVPRRLMPSEWTEDIRAVRKLAKDGPLAVDPDCRNILAAALAVCEVKTDESDCTRLVKRGTRNQARDDAAAALVLAAGAFSRVPKRRRGVYLGAA